MANAPPSTTVPQQTTTTTTSKISVEYNFDYLRSQQGIFRTLEGILALGAIISGSIGANCDHTGGFGYFLFVVIVTLLQSIIINLIFVTSLDKQITFTNIPLTLLINDSLVLISHFLASLLMMLSIGLCYGMITARIFASLFSLGNFLIVVGLVYIDYVWWKSLQSKEENAETNGTTVTESSPTVLTLR